MCFVMNDTGLDGSITIRQQHGNSEVKFQMR